MKHAILGVVALAATALLMVGSSLTAQDTTVAAWTDPVEFVAEATSGTWGSTSPTPSSIVIVAGNTNTSLDSTVWNIPSSSADSSFCVVVTVRGTTSTSAAWQLQADMTLPPFNGRTGSSGVYYQGSTQASFATTNQSPSTLLISGKSNGSATWNASYNNALITDVQPLTITICVSNTPIAATGAASYYSVTQSPTTWTDTKACVAITATGTVTDLEANPFFFGWVATANLAGAKSRITSAGKTVNYVGWSPAPSSGYEFSTSPTTYNPVADSYSITSGRTTAIKGTQSSTITACVYGY
ncbi:hypothetical protein [Salinibacterium sp. NK8237]|uniref:hypothetical protein n=1 Tax=Salinibacterium sp. NK8237 TaxID=2792038 RepID=UPI0018CFAF3A|nr:hypothetical protein [Salinibacterium sp. NK8237]MBH0130276.1 hypothetical protein [Salinibacterium sp. NK8237]